MDFQMLEPFNAGFRSQVCETFKGLDELGTTVRISAVVERVHADENVARIQAPRPRLRAKDRKIVFRAGTYVTGILSDISSSERPWER